MSDAQLIKVRDDAAVWREIDGETVVLDLTSAQYLGLNRSGTRLWSAIVAGSTEDDLIAVLVQDFDVSPERAAVDVQDFLALCRKRGLVE